MAPPFKGRGALSNPADRFSKTQTERVDDGWYVEEEPTRIGTRVEPDHARTVIAHNDSPDIGFEQSINPYRGCEHGCSYCQWGGTPVLMGDGRTRPLALLRVGDEIYGTARVGAYRRYVKTRVLAHWSVIKPAYQIELEDGTRLLTSGDHRFLSERGWKFVTGKEQGRDRRPHLTLGNKLMGIGKFAAACEQDEAYRAGYLCGLIRGDGLIGRYSYRSTNGKNLRHQHHFRLALCDQEALSRAESWLSLSGVSTRQFLFCAGSDVRKPMQALRTHSRAKVDRSCQMIAWPSEPTKTWHAGFLSGIFDAEGSYIGGIIRIPNTERQIMEQICASLDVFGFQYVPEHQDREVTRPIDIVRITGGLKEHLRFFHTVGPAITRKLNIEGQAIKSDAKLRVVSIEPLGKAMRLYDITTGTEDFIANGVVSHNCYARPSHAYMGLSPGLDFETRLFYKENAAQRLTEELARPGYLCKPIAMGSNTDPYQPVEKELRVTRSVLEVLERCRHPVTLVTKSTLILRDLDLLTSLAKQQLVSVAISVTSLDNELKRTLEPRTASPRARLAVIEQLAAAAVPVTVLVAPVIPALNDHEIESILEAVARAGARRAGYVLLRLPYEVKDLFREWLDEHRPLKAQHVMSLINDLRGGRDNDPRFGTRMRGTGPFAALLARRFQLACRRYGLNTVGGIELDTTKFQAPRAPTPQLSLWGEGP